MKQERTEEEKQILADPIVTKFLAEAKKFSKSHPSEGKGLHGELLLWGAAVGGSGLFSFGPNTTLAEMIRSQIKNIVENQGEKSGRAVSADEIIEDLFSPNSAGEIDADIIMGRFQLWS